jgi:hypothetical protein
MEQTTAADRKGSAPLFERVFGLAKAAPIRAPNSSPG